MSVVTSLNVFCGAHQATYSLPPVQQVCPHGKKDVVIPLTSRFEDVHVKPTAIIIKPSVHVAPFARDYYPSSEGYPKATESYGVGTTMTTSSGGGGGGGSMGATSSPSMTATPTSSGGDGGGGSNSNIPTATSPGTPTSTPTGCDGALIEIAIDLLGLDVDIRAWINLPGILDAVGDLLSGLLSGGQTPPSMTRQFERRCNASLIDIDLNIGGDNDTDTEQTKRETTNSMTSKTTTARSPEDCVRECQADAIRVSLDASPIATDCLGISISRGLDVDNCLFVLGKPDDRALLDAKVNALTHAPGTDTLLNTGH